MKEKYLVLFISSLLNSISLTAQQPRDIPLEYPTSVNKSYIRTWDVVKPAVNANGVTLELLRDVKQNTEYFDGLGRPFQTVSKDASFETISPATKTDMVMPFEYDDFGREQFKYLHFSSTSNSGNFKFDPFLQQASYYNNHLAGQQGETNVGTQLSNWAYGQTQFETSPLSRPEKILGPGTNWIGAPGGGKGIEVRYWLNTLADDVKKWVVYDVANSFGNYIYYDSYPAGSLTKKVVINENGNQIIEFNDKTGRTILKRVQLTALPDIGNGANYTGWLSTFYIYDDLNNLRCVIQPNGVDQLASGGWTSALTTTMLNEQCFRYEYDNRNRMIRKKVPATGEQWMVYDKRDRLVLSQDANLRLQNKWVFTKYDILNRAIMCGFYTNTSYTTQNSMQEHLYTQNLGYSETYNPSIYPLYSLNQSFPIVNFSDVLTVAYYDDYSWAGWYGNYATKDNSFDTYFPQANNTLYPYPQSLSQSNRTKGLITGVWQATSGGLLTATYYDENSRAIQIKTFNQRGGIDIFTTQYSFSGMILQTVLRLQKLSTNPQTHTIITKYEYDELSRLLSIKKTINSVINGVSVSKPEVEILKNAYNKLNQVKSKSLGRKKDINGNYVNDPMETLAFDYNIRGWILGINKEYLTDAGNNNYFGLELGYDKVVNSANRNFNDRQLTGNITGLIWKSKGDVLRRKYDFSYDATKRMLRADFEQNDNGSTWGNSTVNFNVKLGDGNNPLTAYDANGNILQLQQWALKITGSSQIDNMRYTFLPGSNQLKNAVDFNNDYLTKLGDFRTAATHPQFSTKSSLNTGSPQSSFDAITDYSYDPNGNLILDNNKSISSITFNHFNLPLLITIPGKGTVSYNYDATGNRLSKETSETNANISYNGSSYITNITTTTTYIGSSIYESKIYSHASLASLNYTDRLLFITHDEGRIRFKHENSTFQFDYFIKDHLGNVRMVLTDEQKQDKYPVASLEDVKVSMEDDYYTIDNSKIVWSNNVTNLPTYTNDNGIGNSPPDPPFEQANSQKIYKLNGNTNKIGLSITLKVMAGDKLDIHGKSYWFENNTGGSGANIAPAVIDLLNGLMGAPTGATAGGHTTASELNGVPAVTNPVGSFIGNLSRNDVNYPQRPKAFINYIFLDEQFRFASGYFSPVNNTAGLKTHFSDLQNLIAPKNGYVYIYVSNESPVNVYFDNLQIVHTRGPILEETHYYPYGLTMSGISSQSLNIGNENKFRYNGYGQQSKEFSDGSGLEWYDYKNRFYDNQLGRFFCIDKLASDFVYYTPYQFAGNEVPNAIDLDGFEPSRNGEYEGQAEKAPVILDNGHWVEGTQQSTWVWKNYQWVWSTPAITRNELKTLFRRGTEDNLRTLETTINLKGSQYGIKNLDILAHYLGQASQETGGFTKNGITESGFYRLATVKEKWGENSYIYKRVTEDPSVLRDQERFYNAVYGSENKPDLGNGNEASGDGYRFRGRGFFQLTGRANYINFTAAYNRIYGTSQDFETNPGLVASDRNVAIISSFWYFNRRTVPAINRGASFYDITGTINAGRDGLEARRTKYNQAKNLLKR